jgi:hypothetical protein
MVLPNITDLETKRSLTQDAIDSRHLPMCPWGESFAARSEFSDDQLPREYVRWAGRNLL